jgi:hypothetical protein
VTPESNIAQRAQFAADLRTLADRLELEEALPVPYQVDGTGFCHGTDAEKVAAVFAAAQLLGTQVEYDRLNMVCKTRLTTGRVTYTVYASVGKQAETGGSVTVSSPQQVLGTLAVAS